jgi:diguanylate cyclase (GGDEF)-like protein
MRDSNDIWNTALPSDIALACLPRPSILIVDDRAENLVATSKILCKLEADVVTVNGGAEALAQCLRRRFAVILMDVQMPIMDGFETADLLAQNNETCTLPIIFLTAISKEEHHVYKGYSSGAVDYISKPVDPTILLSKVRVFLALESQRLAISQIASSYQQLNYRNTLILEGAAAGILGVDGSGCISFLNAAAQRLLAAGEDLIGQPLLPLLDGPVIAVDSWLTHAFREACISQEKIHSADILMYQSGGISFPAEYTFSPMPAKTGVAGGVLIFQNITQRKAIADALDKMAKYDELTGVANRRMFRDVLEKRLTGAKRHGQGLGLLYIDLDNFKHVNDSLGHHVGDKLLQLFCKRVLDCIRHDDTLGRMGGDEFAVMVENSADRAGLFALTQKLVTVCSAPYLIEGQTVAVGISIGIALYPEQAVDADALFLAADSAMYSVKTTTKNNFALFETRMRA